MPECFNGWHMMREYDFHQWNASALWMEKYLISKKLHRLRTNNGIEHKCISHMGYWRQNIEDDTWLNTRISPTGSSMSSPSQKRASKASCHKKNEVYFKRLRQSEPSLAFYQPVFCLLQLQLHRTGKQYKKLGDKWTRTFIVRGWKDSVMTAEEKEPACGYFWHSWKRLRLQSHKQLIGDASCPDWRSPFSQADRSRALVYQEQSLSKTQHRTLLR